MAVLNPQEFFDQADKLIAPPTQVDLRRAVSAAYYGLFHATVAAAADQFVGRTEPLTVAYKNAYRKVSHKELKELCKDAQMQPLPANYQSYVTTRNFGPEIRAFAAGVYQLQQKRHEHDYNPLINVTPSDATAVVKLARAALQQFNKADRGLRNEFLDLLLNRRHRQHP